jgi:hypothetical protein
MEEDDADETKRRSASGLIEHPANPDGQGAIVLANKNKKVVEIMNQFEPAAPPSPVPVRDTKRT